MWAQQVVHCTKCCNIPRRDDRSAACLLYDWPHQPCSQVVLVLDNREQFGHSGGSGSAHARNMQQAADWLRGQGCQVEVRSVSCLPCLLGFRAQGSGACAECPCLLGLQR